MAEAATPEFLAFVADWAAARPGRLEVLEVGGGPKTYLGLTDARFTSLEPSPDSLARSTFADELLLGDAQTFDYGDRRFDIVVFWNVLEHITDVERALSAAIATLRPGGLAVLRGPDLVSLKAIITHRTPHAFHVLFYRKVLGAQDAGKPGHSPFKVEHASDASLERLQAQLAASGLRPAFHQRYVGDQLTLLRARYPLAYHGYQAVSALLRTATRGRLGVPSTDFVLAWEAARD